jgi:hypothetical protein
LPTSENKDFIFGPFKPVSLSYSQVAISFTINRCYSTDYTVKQRLSKIFNICILFCAGRAQSRKASVSDFSTGELSDLASAQEAVTSQLERMGLTASSRSVG